jgi:hypothetical protein
MIFIEKWQSNWEAPISPLSGWLLVERPESAAGDGEALCRTDALLRESLLNSKSGRFRPPYGPQLANAFEMP